MLKDFEDKQKEKMDLVARETKPRQLKRYIDESTIEVNFQQREKLLDKQVCVCVCVCVCDPNPVFRESVELRWGNW